MKVELTYTFESVCKLFQSAGLEVAIREIPIKIKESDPEETILPTWTVKNPYTDKPEELSKAFSRYIQKYQDRLLQSEERMSVYNSFKHNDKK